MKKVILVFKILLILFIAAVFINIYIQIDTKKYIFTEVEEVPKTYTGLVLGSMVYDNGKPSGVVRQRLDKTVELYKAGKIKRILVSGDHGQKDYDEVNTMKNYLLKKGIPLEDIFLDHAGFDTYSSMVRAKEVFEIEDVIIITQKFHLPRSVYVARKQGMDAYGVISNPEGWYESGYNKGRDKISRVKAFFDVMFNRKPKYLGEKIPIKGSNEKTLDQK